MFFVLIRLLVLALSLVVSDWAVAQTIGVTTGTINGTITDDHGDVMPGVTVTVSGSALMGYAPRPQTSAARIAFPASRRVTYRLMFELAGFQSLRREAIQVSVGFTATST